MMIENNIRAGMGAASEAWMGAVQTGEAATAEESSANLTITETRADIGLEDVKVDAEVERSLRRDDALGGLFDRCLDLPAPQMPDFGIIGADL